MSEKFALAPRTEQLYPEGPFLTIRPIDVANDSELLQTWDVFRVVDEEFIGANQVRTADQVREMLRDSEYVRRYYLVAEVESLEGATMVAGVASLNLALKDNAGDQQVNVTVYPAWRSKGIGGKLADALLEIIAHEGRQKATAYGLIHADQDADASEYPAAKIAAKFGLKKVGIDHLRTVKLPLDRDLVDDLHVEVEASLGKYRIITWRDAVPEDHMDQWCALLTQLEKDNPDEGVESEIPEFNEERVRYNEARVASQGSHTLVAVAVAPNGTFAGNSWVEFRTDGSRLAYQENTLVMPEHRGHNLGVALKLMTHRMLSEVEPRVDTVETNNNHTNEHMIRINDKLGYKFVAQSVVFQGKVKAAR